jgi:hypothetical protein
MRTLLHTLAGAASAALLAGTALADQPTRVSPFSVRCVESGSTGFQREGGKWTRKNFNAETMIVHKLAAGAQPSDKDDATYCIGDAEDPPGGSDDFRALNACYGVGIEGEGATYDWCTEYYDKTGGAWHLTLIGCTSPMMPRIRFIPNGQFIASDDQVNIDEASASHDDSIFMSIGRCNLM